MPCCHCQSSVDYGNTQPSMHQQLPMSNLQTIIRNSQSRLLSHESLSSVSAHSVTDQPAGVTTGYRLLRGVSIYNGVALLTASLTPTEPPAPAHLPVVICNRSNHWTNCVFSTNLRTISIRLIVSTYLLLRLGTTNLFGGWIVVGIEAVPDPGRPRMKRLYWAHTSAPAVTRAF